MNIHDYYLALSIGCKKYNLPCDLIDHIFNFEVDSIRHKINYEYLENRLLMYQSSVIKRREINRCFTNKWLQENEQHSIPEEFIFHIGEYPYQIITPDL